VDVTVDEAGEQGETREVDAAAAGARASSTTAVMVPPSTTTARPRTGSAPVPSMMRAPWSTSVSSLMSDLEAGIQGVAETVAEEVDPEHGDQDREAGEGASHHAVER
jgi:hypothetical protein